MNNFEILKQYTIPADILELMLSVYQEFGARKWYEEKLAENRLLLKSQCLERDTFFLSNFLGLNITETRLRLLITKNSAPKNTNEKIVKEVKDILHFIHNNSLDYDFTSSEFLSFLNRIYGRSSHRFSDRDVSYNNKNLRVKEKPISARLKFEKVLETFHQYSKRKDFESLYLIIIAYLEMVSIKPYTSNNELASLLALYFMIMRNNNFVFSYISFFELFLTDYTNFRQEEVKAISNYPENYFNLSGIMRLIFQLIKKAYSELNNIIQITYYSKRAFKSDHIEETIKNLPAIFSKEDVKRHNPDASETTINRVLAKMRDDKLIVPLGKGRSARWTKTFSGDILQNYGEEE